MTANLFSDVPARAHLQRGTAARVTEPSQQSFFDRLMVDGAGLLPPRGGAKFDTSQGIVDGRWHIGVTSSRWHHPRTVRMCGFDPRDTAFWVNLVIGCEGPEAGSGDGTTAARPLVNALRDLYALRSFYQPAAIGEPYVNAPGSIGRSAGYFSHTVWLANPDRAGLETAFDSIGHWLVVNGDDPEFDNFQLNLFFSGHGTGGFVPGDSGIFLRDGVCETAALVDLMLERFNRYEISAGRWQNTLFLDCCHAAAVGRDFVGALLGAATQGRIQGIDAMQMHLLLLSSMHDESSFDMPRAGANSFFTGGYLRENSARGTPRGYAQMADITTRTGGLQHPVLLRLDEGISLRFPALDLLDEDAKDRAGDEPAYTDDYAAALAGLGWEKVEDEPGRIEPLLARAAVLRDRVRARRTNRKAKVVPYAERGLRWDI